MVWRCGVYLFFFFTLALAVYFNFEVVFTLTAKCRAHALLSSFFVAVVYYANIRRGF